MQINRNAVQSSFVNDGKYNSGTYSAGGEMVSPYPLYDTLTIPSATGSIRMFQEQLGVNSKTYADTNMLVSGQVPARQKMIIGSVSVYYTGLTTKVDAAIVYFMKMLRSTYVEFIVAQKQTLFVAPLDILFGSCINLPVVPVATYNVPFIQPNFAGIVKWHIKQPLAAQTPFEWRVTFTETPNAYLQGDKFKLSMNCEFQYAT